MNRQVVQLHAPGGATERAGGGRGAHGLAAAARPEAHGGGAVERGQRREAATGGEAAHQAAGAGGGHGGGHCGGAAPASAPTPPLVHPRVRGHARQPPPLPHVQPPLLGEQETPGLGRLPRHLLAGPRREPELRGLTASRADFVIQIIWYSFHNNIFGCFVTLLFIVDPNQSFI